MNRDPNIHLLQARESRKRNHSQISDSRSGSQESSNIGSGAPPIAATSHPIPPLPTLEPPPQRRFPGDGYDYRRPIMSTGIPPLPAENVIDLTQEASSNRRPTQPPPVQNGARTNRASRGPRFGRNIMADVIDLDDEQPSSSSGQQSSPEVQFLGSNVRRDTRREDTNRTRTTENNPPSFAMRGTNLMNFLRGIRPDPVRPELAQEDLLREEVALRTRHLARAFHNIEPFWIGHTPAEGIAIDLDSDVPIFDYSATGFNPPRTTRSAPPYVPPPPAPAGFTRTAHEEDVVVCPNCDHELGTGDNSLRKQIWIARPCGHVYCGLCTKQRAVSRTKKVEQLPGLKTAPFSKCVVADCGKPVSSPKSMFQIYL